MFLQIVVVMQDSSVFLILLASKCIKLGQKCITIKVLASSLPTNITSGCNHLPDHFLFQ